MASCEKDEDQKDYITFEELELDAEKGYWNGENNSGEGPPATAYLDTGNETYEWHGYVVRVGSIIDESTRTMPVVVKITDPMNSGVKEKALPLLPGTFVRVEIEGRTYPEVYVLPRSAIRPDNTVYLAESGLLEIRDINILRKTGEEAYIDKGLEPEDNVIISPVTAVTANMKIREQKSEE